MSAAPPALRLRVQRLPHAAGLELPVAASAGSVGLDLRAAIRVQQRIQPGERSLIPTGLVVAIPSGFEGQVRPRSGLALEHGLTLLNSPGTIDADYRGEIGVLLINLGQQPVTVARGDRVAQLVIAPVARVDWQEVSDFGVTSADDRGAGGFGSTGR